MKKLALFGMVLATAFLLAACGDDNNPVAVKPHIPLTPQGVYTITGDHAVQVWWNGVYDTDVKEYVIWRSLDQTTNYAEIARVAAEDNPNLNLLNYSYIDSTVANGTTYYYAVSSVDHEGRVSELSAENAFDTPRPQGSVILFPLQLDSTMAGFNLATQHVVNYNSPIADIYLDQFQGRKYINVANDTTDIMDMGYTSNFDEITVSPVVAQDSGWSTLGYFEIIIGHTYIIWTKDDHYAKMRVSDNNLITGSVTFEWGYQTATGNPELAPSMNGGPKRPIHGPNFGNKQAQSLVAR